MPLSLKSLIWKICCVRKAQTALMTLTGLLEIERRLKHFHRPLIYFSLTDCLQSLFLGHPVLRQNQALTMLVECNTEISLEARIAARTQYLENC